VSPGRHWEPLPVASSRRLPLELEVPATWDRIIALSGSDDREPAACAPIGHAEKKPTLTPMADDVIYVRSSLDQATFRGAVSPRLRDAFTPWD
jgi:hypothetical protein